MTLPDFQDWSQGVNVVERVSGDLLTPATITANGPSVTIDTSRYNSLALLPVVPNAVQGNRYGLFLQWQNNGQAMASQTLTFHDRAGNGAFVPGVLFWHIPVRGPQLQIWAVGDANTVIPLHIYGSTRGMPSAEVSPPSSANGRQLLDTGQMTVAAGANSPTWYVRPATDLINIRCASPTAAAPMQLNVAAVACSAVGVVSNANQVQINGNGFIELTGLPFPSTGLEFFAGNNDTATRNLRIQVWDAS